MAFLTDTDLGKIICDGTTEPGADSLVITPFFSESLTPVGYDLCVGSPYATSNKAGIRELEKGESLVIAPGSTALITTLENIQMPQSRIISGLIESKVTKVSEGLSHISTTVDADWKGNLLIAMHNHSTEEVSLEYGETFCTMVLFKNLSPATLDCDKDPGRTDVFFRKFIEDTRRAEQKRRIRTYAPPLIIIVISILGYVLFGNTIGFSAMVVLGIALSLFAAEKFR